MDDGDQQSGAGVSRRALLSAVAATGAAAGVAEAISGDGQLGDLFGGTMALQQAYKFAEGPDGAVWIGPDSAKANVNAASGNVYIASDTQVEYHGDSGSWVKMGVGSSTEPVPSVHTEDARSSEGWLKEADNTISNGTQVENLSFTAKNVWRNVLPRPDAPNTLDVHETQFNADLFGSGTNYFQRYTIASGISTSIAAGELTLSSSSAGAEELITIHGQPAVPHFATFLRIESFSASPGGTTKSNPKLVFAKDAGNRMETRIDVPNDSIDIFGELNNGGGTEQTQTTGLPSRPFDLLVLFIANDQHVLTREDGGDWVHQGSRGTGVDYFDKSTLDAWDVGFGVTADSGASVTVSEFRVMHTLQYGVRDITVATFRDGTPFIRDGWVYVTATCGGSGLGEGQQVVLRINTTSYEVELTGVLFSESRSGKAYNDTAGQLMYDEERDTWFWFASGWGTTQNGPDGNAHSYVGSTKVDPLHGVHIIETDDMNLPNTGNGANVYDPFVVYDESAGAWRCIHNYSNLDVMAVSETTDESFTSGWSTVDKYTSNGGTEGGKITKVDGEYVSLYKDSSVTNDMVSADYPSLSTNRQGIDLDVNPLGNTAHPMIVPVQRGDMTRYLLLAFDQSKVFGLGSRSRGAMWVFESDQTADGYEFPTKTAYR